MIVCLVTTTTEGTAVCWYRSEIAAENGRLMVSATRTGVHQGHHLIDDEVPSHVMRRAEQAHELLRADAYVEDLRDWATHYRVDHPFGPVLVPVAPTPAGA